MRRLDSIIFLIIIVIFSSIPSFANLKGNIEYMPPIDYSVINKTELDTKADFYFSKIISRNNPILDEDLSQGLILYTILSNKCPDNAEYFIRLGRLYDLIGKDKYAKSRFYQAISINKLAILDYIINIR